jgi:acyl-coenzyme A synthetase/AMP-(fatty) acid ligase
VVLSKDPESRNGEEMMDNIATFVMNGLPKYAIPLCLRFMSTLPAAGNNKHQEHVLRRDWG